MGADCGQAATLDVGGVDAPRRRTPPPRPSALARQAGQHGACSIELAPSAHRTHIAGRRSSAPFGPPLVAYPDGSGIPEVQVTNPGGGVLGGDRLELAVHVGAGARATVCTQGATKVYRGPAATQRAHLAVAAGGVLEYVPHHVIPYAGSRYRQETTIELAGDAVLIAWEALAAGRVARGERFAFDHLASRTLVLREGLTEAADGCELEGGGEPFAGRSYLATAYLAAPWGLEAFADDLHAAFEAMPRTLASASTPASGVAAVRILADDAPALAQALTRTRTLARAALGLPPPAREVI